MRKKVLSFILAGAMVLGLGACAGGGNAAPENGANDAAGNTEQASAKDNTDSGEVKFVIGYPAIAATNTTMEAMKKNREVVANAMGGELITEDWDFSAEGTIQAVEKLIERGADGVIVTPTDQSILPTITQMCEEAGVYWTIAMRTIEDPDVKDIVYASDYYLGYVYEPGLDIGRDLAQAAVDSGCKKYALISSPAGDTDGTIREEGIAEIADANGMECVGVIRGLSDVSEATSSVESLIAANPDMDCIIRVTSSIAGDGVALCEAIEASGKANDITVISFNTEDGMEQYIENGVCDVAFTDCNIFDSLLASTILCNKLNGTPISDDKIELNLYNFKVESLDQLNDYNTYINTTDYTLYTREEAAETLVGISLADLQANVIDTFSIDSVAARRQ